MFQQLIQGVLDGDETLVLAETKKLHTVNISPLSIINQGLIEGMNQVGKLFKAGELFIPEVMMAANTVSTAIAYLQPFLKADDVEKKTTVVIGTVKGDLHDIGKNLVAMMLESSGFTVINLGADIAPEDFLQAVQENNAEILGLSALLTTTMPMMKTTIDAFEQAGLRNKVKIIIGGAPVSNNYAQEIKADGYSADAVEAVALVKKLMA